MVSRFLAACALAACLCGVATAQRFTPTPTPNKGGTSATIDLPAAQHMRNTGGSDGLGLCVFTSIQHSARWQNLTDLDGYRRWMEARPGGGYPSKVDQTLKAFCQSRGIPVPEYIQHTGGDAEFLDLAIKTGRCPAVTYCGADDFYRGTVAHMVTLAHLDQTSAVIIDNNRPGVWLWMSRADFLQRWRGNRGGWAFVFLSPPPPPHPSSSNPADMILLKPELIPGTNLSVIHPRPATLDEAAKLMQSGSPCPCKAGGPCDCWDGCECGKGGQQVFGQCPGGSCAGGRCRIVPAFPEPSPEPPPELAAKGGAGWQRIEFSDGPGWKLYQGGRLAGLYDGRGFHPSTDGRSWTVATVPLPVGVVVPADAVATAGDVPPTGVIPDPTPAPEYSRTGSPCSKGAALAALVGGPGGLEDDSGKWALSIVGPSDFLARVQADVAKLPAADRGKLLVTYYAPTAWQVSHFALSGGATLRRPAVDRVGATLGTVAAADYTAAKLADLIGCPGGPNPKPLPPPAPPSPSPAPSPSPSPAPVPGPAVPPLPVGWLILAAVAYFLLRKRPEPAPAE